MGDDGIRGMLIVLIAGAGLIAGGGWWRLWGGLRLPGRYIHGLKEIEASAPEALETNTGRARLIVATGPPDEITAATKWASVLSVLLSCVPVVGVWLAGYALYNTWERKSAWYGVAWLGMIFGCVGSFCVGLTIVLELLGEPTILSDF